MNQTLRDKVIVIIGGTTGIGSYPFPGWLARQKLANMVAGVKKVRKERGL